MPSMRHETALDLRARVRRALWLAQASVADDARAPATPEELAAAASLSRYHFSRLFAAMTGESPAALVRRLRLERAAGELARTDLQVVRIALHAGYEAHEPFTRAFTRHFGRSPSAYRAEYAGSASVEFPPAPSRIHFGIDDAINRFVPLMTETNPMMQVEIKQTPARRLAAMRHIGSYHDIGPVFERLYGWAAASGPLGADTEAIGVYYDDPRAQAPETLRSDACMTCGPAFTGDEAAGVRVIELDGGDCAVSVFKGPYQRLDEAYQWLYANWLPTELPKLGREPAERPVYEVYLNDPQSTAPEELLTAIHVPLA